MISFSNTLGKVQRMLGRNGYHTLREPIDIGDMSDVIDCEIIARNDEYDILYMEAQSGWRGIARTVAEYRDAPCMVFTKRGDSLIVTTVRDKMTTHPQTRHIVIQPESKKWGLAAFVMAVKSGPDDDHISIDERVQNAFDKFSTYEEAIKKFEENLGEVISDTRNLIASKISDNPEYDAEAEKFVLVCKEILNDTISKEDIKGMLVQHVVTARIFATVYDYEFYKTNSIAQELERLRMILGISDHLIDYSAIELVAESITDNASRQQFIRNIYETFYKKYDPKRANRDGIVYTPIEVVDFIINSVEDVLVSEFDTNFVDGTVKILDPFTGTGTFLARLLETKLTREHITEKYTNDMFANEMLLLAFYIATVNIESTYVDLTSNKNSFEGMNYTDTFQMDPRYLEGGYHKQESTRIDKQFVDIKKRRQKQYKSNLNVIVSNPPYSAGQSNYNDQNQNVSYPKIDQSIKDTYVRKNKGQQLIRSVYDSYLRALRWASDRIGESGVIAFVTNGSFIKSEAASGVRASLYEEFTDIWCFDLRGNQRTQGETSKKEGGKIFGSGSRAPVAITILVKNPAKHSCTIHYKDIGDYHTREKKLKIIRDLKSITGIKDWQIIKPDKYHDWVNQRIEEFSKYLPIGSKEVKIRKGSKNAIFKVYSMGIATGRDVWMYNSSKTELVKNMKKHIDYCNSQNLDEPKLNPRQAKWTEELSHKLARLNTKSVFDKSLLRKALYRPFFKQYVYFETKAFVHRPYQIPKFFPKGDSENLSICIPYKGTSGIFSSLITDSIPDLNSVSPTQCFPLRVYADTHMRERERAENLAIIITHKPKGQFSVLITDTTPDIQVQYNGQCFPFLYYTEGRLRREYTRLCTGTIPGTLP